MSFERFIISVNEQWRVTVTHNSKPIGPERPMERGTGEERIWPQAPAAEKAGLKALGRNAEPNELEEMLSRITRRRPKENEVATLGMHLFDALLGKDLWDAIKSAAVAANAPGIELALKFPTTKNVAEDLGRLQWEMLNDGSRFLAEGVEGATRLCRVAITRMVTGAKAPPRLMDLPPRALFIVGCDVEDEKIRPGAEFFGLLRQLRHSAQHRAFHPRLLVQASVQKIKREIASFKPDIVHFICHGNANGELEFAPEPGEPVGTGPQLLGAEQVWGLFEDNAGNIWRPAVVVLGACHTALPSPADNNQSPSQELFTAQQSAPLAALLVDKGVPIVVGMAGRVADQACRLFTRSFGEALLIGRPLIEATEIGRRAAFWTEKFAQTNSDWALPTLFLAEDGVGPDFAATEMKTAAREERIHHIVAAFRSLNRKEPYFSGRVETLAKAYSGLGSGQTGLITLLGDPGFGRTRLLQELVELAVRDGHLPVLVSTHYHGGKPATDLTTLIEGVESALTRAQEAFLPEVDLENAPKFQVQILSKLPAEKQHADQLREDVSWKLVPDKQPTVAALVLALRHDLKRLLEAARQVPDSTVTATGWPILFIDDLEQLGSDVLEKLFTGDLIKESGIGPQKAPIPLVVAFNSDKTWQALKETTLSKISADWVHSINLKPFSVQLGEDLAAYRQVLLNPHNPEFWPEVSHKRWVIPDEKNPGLAKKWIPKLQVKMKAIPADFNSKDFYEWVDYAATADFVVEANDDDVLKSLRT